MSYPPRITIIDDITPPRSPTPIAVHCFLHRHVAREHGTHRNQTVPPHARGTKNPRAGAKLISTACYNKSRKRCPSSPIRPPRRACLQHAPCGRVARSAGMVELLLDHYEHPDCQDVDGETPLYRYASRLNSIGAMRQILLRGADAGAGSVTLFIASTAVRTVPVSTATEVWRQEGRSRASQRLGTPRNILELTLSLLGISCHC
jgi:hypothetical protein